MKILGENEREKEKRMKERKKYRMKEWDKKERKVKKKEKERKEKFLKGLSYPGLSVEQTSIYFFFYFLSSPSLPLKWKACWEQLQTKLWQIIL